MTMPRRSPKPKLHYVCQSCGFASPKWQGRCPACNEWNTLIEEPVDTMPARSSREAQAAEPVAITEVPTTAEPRLATGIGELDRVLGGGLVPGSLVLVAGEPGAGKSTLLLAAAQRLAAGGQTVLYVSGEESLRQIKLRADRLQVDTPALLLLAETDLDVILAACERVGPHVLIVDSIQTVYKPDIPSAPGSVGQVRECTAALLRIAKGRTITTFVVGHVTKEGQLAGPRVLEHIVDTVLYFEGDRHHAFRLLRATKNRFGSTNEIGVFEMRTDGLQGVANPSAVFLAERATEAPGSTVVCAMEGSRPLLVEVQALVSPTVFGLPRRTASGVDYNRMILLLAVLEKRAGLHLSSQDVYVSVAGGIAVDEPAIDLGIAAAITSSFRNRPVDPTVVAIGEVGLAGEIRTVPHTGLRVQEATRLGFRRCIIPHSALEAVTQPKIDVIGVTHLAEALSLLVP